MSSNPNWPRWLFASVSKHFHDRRGDTAFYIEGQERKTPVTADLFEFRMDGPYETEINKNYWRLFIEVSILIQSVKGTDFHQIHRLNGVIASAFTAAIPVYKYGDGDDDDDSLLGCLNLVQNIGKRERIQVNNFGIIEPSTGLLQSTVEGHYEMFLDVTN